MNQPAEKPASATIRISRILVATDFSVQAEHALTWAQHLSRAFGAKLVLLHVIDTFSLAEVSCRAIGSEMLPLVRAEGKEGMDRWLKLAPDAETVIREGSPRPLIVECATELKCQMIVMGTHGRSGLAHLLLGSVAEYVVRNSRVPVLTIQGP